MNDVCAWEHSLFLEAEGLVFAQEALVVTIILFDQLRHVVFILDELASLVERKLLKALNLSVSQWDTLRSH